MYLPIPRIHLKKISAEDLSNDAYAMFFVLLFCLSEFLHKSICCGYLFELHLQVDAIQMVTHNICFYKEVDKKYTDCNLKTTKLRDCVPIGVCEVIMSNTVVCRQELASLASFKSVAS